MTGQDFQDRLAAIVEDLQTRGKGRTVNIMFRGENNTPNILPLSSDANGVVNAAQLQAVQAVVTQLGATATAYDTAYAPVKNALEAFKTAQEPHQPLIDAATNARNALNDALTNDPAYQSAKTALDDARNDPNYIAVSETYKAQNVSENYSELSQARGKYS